MIIALASGKRTCILTTTRGLQDQYLDMFPGVGLADIRGRDNYACELKPDYSCTEGKAVRCPYWGSVACPASQAEMRIRSSNLGISSYAKWTSTRKYGGCLDGFEQLILDECHQAEPELVSAVQVVLHHHEVEEIIKVPFLNGEAAQSFPNWKSWAQSARIACEDACVAARAKIDVPDAKPTWVRAYTHLTNLLTRIATIALANPKDWVCDETEDGWQFDPIRPARYAEFMLFCKIPRIILGSATARPKTLNLLGFYQDRFDFYEYPSEFDPSRCPTYHVPTMRMDHRQEDYSPLYLKIDQILNRRGDRKGIVHTVSWKRRDEILACSRYRDRMMANDKGEPPTQAIEDFQAAPPPAVLVSPSVSTGYDFAGPMAEYQIITKIPFPDGRSKIAKARQEADKDYGPYQAMQGLVQTVGRIMRSKEDRGESYVLDDHIEWFAPRFGHFAPKSFGQFFKQVVSLPSPPPKL